MSAQIDTHSPLTTIGKVSVQVDLTSLANACEAISSLLEVLISPFEALCHVIDRIGGIIPCRFHSSLVLTDDVIDLLWREFVAFPATGTSKLDAIEVHPSNTFLELVSALTSNRHANVIFSHGWPILSLVGDTASMTEAGGESIAPGGGAE